MSIKKLKKNERIRSRKLWYLLYVCTERIGTFLQTIRNKKLESVSCTILSCTTEFLRYYERSKTNVLKTLIFDREQTLLKIIHKIRTSSYQH